MRKLSNRMHRCWPALLCLAGTLLLAGCVKPGKEVVPSRDFEYVSLHNGLTDVDREAFYHISEGSELAPLAMFRTMQVINGQNLSDWLEGYGFIPDPDNKDGLPIGFSVHRSRTSGIDMVGLNCAGCHVTDIHYQGKRFRVDGAPNQIDIIRFYRDLADHGMTIATSLDRAFSVFRGSSHKHDHTRGLVREFETVDELTSSGHVGAHIVERMGHILAAESVHVAESIEQDGHDFIHDVLTGTRLEHDQVLLNEHVDALSTLTFESNDPLHKVLGAEHHVGARNILGDFTSFARLLHAQVAYLGRLKDIVDGMSLRTGPGRIDAFGIVRNLLFIPPDELFPVDAPVSIPHLWGLKDVHWLHWNANTNSVMQRNIAQALGTGALVDTDTWDTTVILENLAQLEALSHLITAPKWPEEVLGPLDRDAIERGRPIYEARCASCHDQGKTKGLLVEYELFALITGQVDPAKKVDTDPNYAHNFDQAVGDRPFPAAVQQLVGKVEDHYYETYNVSEATQREWKGEGREQVIWRTPLSLDNTAPPVHPVYPARPLAGVWATAPYLHNGSVPSLYALLTPYDEYYKDKDKTFHVGHREFDPVNVGYEHRGADHIASHKYDTTLPGNSPRGHEFGFDLDEAEKMDLIEFLKSL